MPILLGYDANNTDGSDLSLMDAIYSVAGRHVRVPADYNAAQIKAYIMQQYNIDSAHYDQLQQLNSLLESLDFTTITQLTDNATAPELVDAIQTLAQVTRQTVAMLRFLLREG